MLNVSLHYSSLAPAGRAALVKSLMVSGLFLAQSPALQAEPAADHVWGECRLSPQSVNRLLADISASAGGSITSPQVDYVVLYTRDNPNHGQSLATAVPPATAAVYSGPVICANGVVASAGQVSAILPSSLNQALGSASDPMSVAGTEQSLLVQYVPAGAAKLENAQNKFCHSSTNTTDCFRISQLTPPAPAAPAAPATDRVWGGCELTPDTVSKLLADMTVSGGVPVENAKVDFLIAYSRANPNQGQALSGTSFTGPVLCRNPAAVAVGQVAENTVIPPLVDFKSLTQATYLQYAFQSDTSSTENKICHSAAENIDCFLVKPAPPPVKVYTSEQNFNTDGAGLGYTLSIGYGDTAARKVAETAENGFLRLTVARGGLLNMIAFDRMNEGAFSKLVVDFDFRMDENGLSSIPRADGIGFAFLNTAANQSINGASSVPVYEDTNRTMPIGTPSGYAKSSLQIGIDTYNNGTADQNNANHISLFYDGLEIAHVNVTGFDLANKVFNHAHVEALPAISPQAGCNVTLKVTPSGASEIVIFDAVNIPGMVPYNGRAVFGGRTGASWETHDIDNVTIKITE